MTARSTALRRGSAATLLLPGRSLKAEESEGQLGVLIRVTIPPLTGAYFKRIETDQKR